MEIAPRIKDVTEAVHQLPPLVDALINLLQSPTGLVVLAAFFLWLLVNKDFSRFYGFKERKERQRLEHLDLYVAKPELADAEAVKVLRDLRDAHYFKIATGIYAEKNLRSALIKLHDQTSHQVSWGTIRRAFPYIHTDNRKQVRVRELTIFEKFGYWYNSFVGYSSLLAAAGILSLFIFSTNKSFASFAWGLGETLALVFFAMFVFLQNWPEDAAKRIQKELEELSEQEAGIA